MIALACGAAAPALAQPNVDPPPPRAASAGTSAVALRPIDRATVRIVSVRGLGVHVGPGRRTRAARPAADAATSHGSGVVIEPQLVLTARHVVWGAEAWVVFPAGSTTPIAARPVYVDVASDIAFLVLDRPLEHHTPLPQPRQLTLSERVSVSGYPLDLLEPIPAAVSGEVSRVTRSGELHLAMSVNPGHSGGPVIDAEGRLVGIVSARGRPERGVEGLTIAVTMQSVRAARERVPAERPSLGEADRDLAAAIALLTGIEDESLVNQLPQIAPILQRALGWPADDADRDVIVAALAWNALLELLESRNAHELPQLPDADRTYANRLLASAQQLARRALASGPHIRRRFPIVRAISLGHVDVEASRPPPFH